MASNAKNPFNEMLGEKIRAFREKNGLTQKAVAKIVDKGESTVRMWELGKSRPDYETLTILAELFKVPTDALTGFDDDLFASALTTKEQAIILYYRSNAEIREAIDELLESADESVPLYTAAKSDMGVADAIIYVKKSEWERIRNAPETDDTLL